MAKVIEAIYENGVFKPLEKVDLKEGERVKIEIKEGLADIIEKYSRKVKEDVLKKFLKERR
ncbi:MAG: antitoxin family protein [Candidatus Aenigmatarchaeota archaeon]